MAKVLVGFMGAGKTSVARALSTKSLDMDTLLEARLGISITDYFKQKGEKSFRQQETQLLTELIQTDDWLSTGGGLVTLEENRNLLKQASHVIYLKADFEILYQRLLADKSNERPLMINHSQEDLQTIFNDRLKWYEKVATITIEVSEKTIAEIVVEISLLTEDK